VVEKDLIEALKAETGRTVILDVTDPEPPTPDSEQRKMDNIILTTHIAGSRGRELERMGCYMADEFMRYIKGEDLNYGVTVKMLETMA